MVKHFITFGSHSNYIDAARRLAVQATELEIFDKITAYTLSDLKSDPDFWSRHGAFISRSPRGFGYWLWKSYLIKKQMETLQDGDILMYLDCGCEFDKTEKDYLLHCMEVVKQDKLLGTNTWQLERNYNKMDLFLKLNMNDPKYTESLQNQAGALLFMVCDDTRGLINEWYTLGSDYHNIDDSPSVSPNFDGFRDHRHDQSIFSLITKKSGIYSKTELDTKCVKYIRNRSGARNY